MAGSVDDLIFRISWLKPGSSAMESSGMVILPTWLVTPWGRMASISGWAEVLVEGMTIPTFSRNPSVSVIVVSPV
jgi:hypothetical protein